MNKLRLFFQFFNKNILKSLALFIIFVGSGIIISDMVSRVEFNMQAVGFFQGDGIENSDVVSVYRTFEWCFLQKQEPTDQNGDTFYYAADELNKAKAEFVKKDVYAQIKNLPAVDKVFSYTIEGFKAFNYKDISVPMCFADMDTYNRFSYRLSDGCWFGEYDNSSPYPPVVLCGSEFDDFNIGDDIEINYYVSEKKHKVHIIGKVAAPYMTIDSYNLGDFYRSLTYESRVFMLNDERTVAEFGEQIKRNPTSAIVQYKRDATPEDIQKCRDFYCSFFSEEDLKQIDVYEPYDEMLEYSKTYFDGNVNAILKSGLLYAFIAAFMLVVLTVLMLRSKQKEYNIHLILGRTKLQIFMQSLFGILFIAIAAGIVCTIYLVLLNSALSHGFMNTYGEFNNRYAGPLTYSVLWGYIVIVTLIASIIPYIMVFRKKMTLITLNKQNK